MEKQQEGCVFIDYIPGGTLQCLNDSAFTMSQVNQSFLGMFGFMREELQAEFQGSFLEMIHPADRQFFIMQTLKQLKERTNVSLSYRVLCKGGGYKWIASNAKALDDSSKGTLFCMMLELEGAREAQEEYRKSLDRLQLALDQSSDILFEWTVANRSILCSPNWLSKFGYSLEGDGPTQPDAVLRHLHPDDIPAITAFIKQLEAGATPAPVEIRIQHADGRYTWCRVQAANQFDEAGTPLRILGTVTDIDKEKQMFEDLRKRAELDALTGLYNHAETELRTRQHLEGRPEKLCALFIIDVDDFIARGFTPPSSAHSWRGRTFVALSALTSVREGECGTKRKSACSP